MVCPTSPRRRLSCRRLLRTHFCSLIGSPAVSGATNASSAGTSVASFFFDRWTPATRQPHPIRRTIPQRGRQLLAPPPDRLFVDPGDLRQQHIPAVPDPVGFHGHVPAPLLLIQPAQQQVHL